MALGKMSEPEMVIPSLNPGGEVGCTRVDPEMVIPGLHPGGYLICTKIGPEVVVVVVKLNLVAELSDSGVDPKPWFNKQKLGSIVPKQRKLVKLLMFERLAQFLRRVFCPRCASSSGASSLAKNSFCCFKNGNPVHPHTIALLIAPWMAALVNHGLGPTMSLNNFRDSDIATDLEVY